MRAPERVLADRRGARATGRALLAALVAMGAACAGARAVPADPVVVAPPGAASDAVPADAVAVGPASDDPDGDGLAGAADACPERPEDCDGFEDQDGCPDVDNDRDLIADVCDRCPDDPETYNGIMDDDGCPERAPVVLRVTQIRILERVMFAPGATRPIPDAMRIIDATAAVMAQHPEIQRVAVVGHAARGEPGAARLSLRRAQAVVDLLVARGVDRARLEAHGAGDAWPIVPYTSPRAGLLNRRAEYVIVRANDQPTMQWDGGQMQPVTPAPPVAPPRPVEVVPDRTVHCPGMARVPDPPPAPPGGCPR